MTDKALNNAFLLGIVHRVFPNATLIHCRRHPIDTALSIFSTDFAKPLGYANGRSDLVFFYRQYQRIMAHWRQTLPPDRFIEVDYEALVADPEPHAQAARRYLRPRVERGLSRSGSQPAKDRNRQRLAGAPAHLSHVRRTLEAL